jgi:pimeloyl-ACP methyl ester carboxylesterase
MNIPLRFRLVLTLIAVLSGCASQPLVQVRVDEDHYRVTCTGSRSARPEDQFKEVQQALQKHIISIDKQGQYQPLHYTLDCAGKREEGRQPELLGQHFARIGKTIAREKYKEIVVIIHGGLVSPKQSVGDAIRLHQAIEHDPVLRDGGNKVYPIFINWRSGGLESYWDQLVNIRNGDPNPPLAGATAPFKVGSDLGSGVADTLYTAGLEGSRLVNSLGDELNACQQQPALPRIICPDPVTKNNLQAGTTLQYFLMTPVRVGTAPLINGLGGPSWENMVRQTRNLFLSESTTDADKDSLTKSYRGAVYNLFRELKKTTVALKQADANQQVPLRLTLIGHSMGTMVISEIIQQFPDLPYRNIVFMGAAVSGRDFRNMVIPVLEHSTDRDLRFYSVSLLPSNEARETNYGALIPSGSLLEWVDEMYTSPPTFADRTFGKWVNAKRLIMSYPEEARARMTFRVFGNEDGQPSTHGGLNDVDTCFWRPSYWTDENWSKHREDCGRYLGEQGLQ